MPCAFCLALPRTGKNIPASMATMAITTSSSMSVKARFGKAFEDHVERRAFIILFSFLYSECRAHLSRLVMRHAKRAIGRGRQRPAFCRRTKRRQIGPGVHVLGKTPLPV